jgi:hypothetical protein
MRNKPHHLASAFSALRSRSSDAAGTFRKEALEAHFQKTPDHSILSIPGPIRSVKCSKTSLTFRGSDVYACDVAYDDGTIGVVCGARIEGEVVTNGLPRNCTP